MIVTLSNAEARRIALAAQGFAKREMWRPALQAYKESLRLHEDADRRQAFEKMLDEPEHKRFQGGQGYYPGTRAHPPFVHVDVRGTAARWRG